MLSKKFFKHFSNDKWNTHRKIVLIGASGSFSKRRCYVNLLKEIWKFAFIFIKIERLLNVVIKNASFCYEFFIGTSWLSVALRMLSFFISVNTSSTLTRENWSVHSLVALMIAMVLGFFLFWKLLSPSDMILFRKGLVLFELWDLTRFNKKAFKIYVF